jgi:hypothetical protein
MGKLIGYVRVSTRAQDFDRQIRDLLAAGVRRDDLYTDHGVSGARASGPAFNRALEALHEGDTLVITTLDRLGRSTVNMLGLAEELRARGPPACLVNRSFFRIGIDMVSHEFSSAEAYSHPRPGCLGFLCRGGCPDSSMAASGVTRPMGVDHRRFPSPHHGGHGCLPSTVRAQAARRLLARTRQSPQTSRGLTDSPQRDPFRGRIARRIAGKHRHLATVMIVTRSIATR